MTESEWLSSNDPAVMLEWLTRRSTTTDQSDPRIGRKIASYRKIRLFAAACCRHVWPLLVCEQSRNAVTVAEKHADGEATEEEFTAAQNMVSEILTNPPGSPTRYAELMARATLMSPGVAAKSAIDCCRPAMLNIYPAQAAIVCDIFGNPFKFRPHVAVGDVVETVHKRGFGSNERRGVYGHAVVVSVNPFVLVSRDGLEVWRTYKPADVVRSNVHPKDNERALSRWAAESKQTCTRTMAGFNEAWKTRTVLSLATAAYEERTDEGVLDVTCLGALSDALEEAGCCDEELLMHLRGFRHVEVTKMGHHVRWEWDRSLAPHYRGCWALDLILGKE